MDRGDLDQLVRLVRPLAMRVANTVARGVVQLVNDAKKLQTMQLGVLEGEDVDDGEHHQPYGFSSVPLPGAEAVVVFPNGDRSHPLVVAASDRRYRPTGGQSGEVCMYTDEGDVIRLGRGNVISLVTSGTVKLGSAGATEGAIKGNARNSAEQTFLTALTTYIGAIQAIADPAGTSTATFATAISTFATAITAAISSKVKLE